MTRLTRPVRRRLPLYVVSLYPNGLLGVRVPRTRTEYTVPVSRVFRLAVEIKVAADADARRRAKDEARRARGLDPLPRKVRRGLL